MRLRLGRAGVSRVEHHPFDRYYNFFSRTAWTVASLAHQVAVAIVLALNPTGPLYLVVDDTLLHKRGQKVYGLGWFRDAVASTAKRVATASGNNWVVMGLVIPIPLSPKQILCLPLLARWHLPGKANPSGVDLAAEMLAEVQAGSPTDNRPDRGWRLRGPRLARGLGPAGSVRGADARRRGDLRSAGAAPARWQARPQAEEGTATAQPARRWRAGPTAIATARSPGRGTTSR